MKMYAWKKNRIRLLSIALLSLFAGCARPPADLLAEVEEFGSNPGELRMFKYVPASLDSGGAENNARLANGQGEASKSGTTFVSSLPLVVALHGCMQDAAEYARDSGWVRLADRWGFLLLLPEQRRGNNLTKCFRWYSPDDQQRDAGEALSIRQMIDRMRRDYAIDPQRIFVTGISAGAAMTLVLAADYPEIFTGAAPVAGIAFGCADGFLSALSCMRDPPEKDADAWGEAVRSATSHKGPWPRISVWQGEEDSAVNPKNATTIVRQWTNVQGIDDIPEETGDLEGHVHSLYRAPNGQILVESYRIKGMAHGLPVDPGSGEDQCGKAGRFFPDVDICSSLWIARFWGLNR